jgi:hypothetical protein
MTAPTVVHPVPLRSAPRLALGPLGIAVRLIVAVVILMGANLLAMGAVPGILSLIPAARDAFGGSSPLGFVLGVVLQALVLTLVVLATGAWMRWIERRPLRDAGWRWSRRSVLWLLLGVLVAASSLVAVVALLPSTGPVVPEDELPGGGAPVVLVLLYLLGQAFLQQAIPEELLFRGWLLSTLRARPVIAVVVTTLAFTAIHLVSSGGQQSPIEHVLYLALPFGFSLLAVGLLLWTGSLWAAAGVHGGFHVGNAVAVVLLPQVDPVVSWLAIGGVQTLIGLVLTVTALRRGRGILDGRD